MKLTRILKPSLIKQYFQYLRAKGVNESSIKRKQAAMAKFTAFAQDTYGINKATIKKASSPATRLLKNLLLIKEKMYPNFFTWYLPLLLLTLLGTAMGIAVYRQFFSNANSPLAYPSTLTAPPRILSFQGRLTDDSDNPIITATDFIFRLYTVETDGSPVWTSNTCAITPDQDGIFSTRLGATSGSNACGPVISEDIFTSNNGVWLEVQVNTEVLDNRQPIASSAYALNSETLQGFPPASPATASTIPIIDSNGDLLIGASNPDIVSSSGTFTLTGEILSLTSSGTDVGEGGITLQAADTSDASITLNPDGAGVVDMIFEGTAPDTGYGGFVNATNASLTSGSLYYGEVASNATGYNMLEFQAGETPSEKLVFQIADGLEGRLGINNASPGQALDVSGNATVSGNLTAGGQIQTGRFASAPTAIGEGALYYNPTDNNIYMYNGSQWVDLTDTGSTLSESEVEGYIYDNDNTLAGAWSVAFGNNSGTFDLTGSGDFVISDNSTPFATFADDGTFTLDNIKLDGNTISSLSASALTLDSASGTVTIAAADALSNGTWSIASDGTLTGTTWNGNVIGTGYGGLGADVTAAGGGEILYSTSTTTYDSLAAGSSGQLLTSGGTSAPSWSNVSSLLTAGDDIDISGTTNATIALEDDIDVSAIRASSIAGLGIYDDGSNLGVFVEDGGYVGIGTTDPRVELEVNGYIYASRLADKDGTSWYIDPALAEANAVGAAIYGRVGIGTSNPQAGLEILKDSVDLIKASNSAETSLFIVDSGGNVGIGTTSPDGNLHIGDGDSDTNVFLSGNTSVGESGLRMHYNDTLDIGVLDIVGDVTGQTPQFRIRGSDLGGTGSAYNFFTADLDTGRVGIGTTAPKVQLDVNGAGMFTSESITLTDARTGAIFMDTNNAGLMGRFTYGGSPYYRELIRANSSNQIEIGHSATAVIDGIVLNAGSSSAVNGNIYLRTSNTDRLTVLKSGRVGIGTTNPIGPLTVMADQTGSRGEHITVQGLSNSNLKGYFGIDTDNSPPFLAINFVEEAVAWRNIALANAGGNVGIGTTSPRTKLEVARSTSGMVATLNGTPTLDIIGNHITARTTSTVQEVLRLHQPNTYTNSKGSTFGIGLSFWEDSGSNYPRTRVDFRTTGRTTDDSDTATTVMSLRDDGNVGIGTTDPSKNLHIYNSSGATMLLQGATNNDPSIQFKASGVATNRIKAGIYFENTGNYEAGKLHLAVASQASDANVSISDSRLAIDYNGNVGIGTTSPEYKLDVAGHMRTTGMLAMTGTTDSYVSGGMVNTGVSQANLNMVGLLDNYLIRANEKAGITVTYGGTACSGKPNPFDGRGDTSCTVSSWTNGVTSSYINISYGAAVQHYWYGFKAIFPYGRSTSTVRIQKYWDPDSSGGCDTWSDIYYNTSFTGGEVSVMHSSNHICQIRVTLSGTAAYANDVRFGEIAGYRYFNGHLGEYYVHTTGDTIYGDLTIGTTTTNRNLIVNGNVGIGTTDLGTWKLKVAGGIYSDGDIYGHTSLYAFYDSTKKIRLHHSGVASYIDFHTGQVIWRDDGSTTRYVFYENGNAQADTSWTTFSPYLSYNYTETGKTKNDYSLGDIVSLKESERWTVTQATNASRKSVYGVVVHPEGFISIPKEMKDEIKNGGEEEYEGTNSGKDIESFDNVVPVAHLGEASTKVILNPRKDIKNGSQITTSVIQGFATLAEDAGATLGKALESTQAWNETNCPLVSNLNTINWPEDDGTNPTKPCFRVPVSSFDNAVKDKLIAEYGLSPSDYIYVGKLMTFVNVSWYDPDVYLSDTGDIEINGIDEDNYLVEKDGSAIDKIGLFSKLFVAEIKSGLVEATKIISDSLIAGKIISEEKVISPIVETNEITIGDSETDKLEIKNTDNETVVEIADDGTTTHFGDLIVKNDLGEEVAKVDTQGNAEFDGKITAAEIEVDNLVAQEATFSTVYADNIIADGGSFKDIMADKISAVRAELERIVSTKTATSSGDTVTGTSLYAQAQDWPITPDGSTTAQSLDNIEDLGITGRISANEAFIYESLIVDNLVLTKQSLTSLDGILMLQPQGVGKINLLAGVMIIEDNGSVTINGSLTITGSLAANEYRGVDGNFNVNLIKDSLDSESGFGMLNVYGQDGQVVASVDQTGNADFAGDLTASGSASFAKLNIESENINPVIAADSGFGELATSSAQISTNASAGSGSIMAGHMQVEILTDKVNSESLIYVTPTSDTLNQVLFIKQKGEGKFTVGIRQTVGEEIKFNWWVIN